MNLNGSPGSCSYALGYPTHHTDHSHTGTPHGSIERHDKTSGTDGKH